MSEDYTYQPVQFAAVPAEDLAELLSEAQAANRRIAELEARLAAVPVGAMRAIVEDMHPDNWNRKALRAVTEWLNTQEIGKP